MYVGKPAGEGANINHSNCMQDDIYIQHSAVCHCHFGTTSDI